MSWDGLSHLAEIIAILSVGLPILRKVIRIADALESFPPHRHINGGRISYPKGFEPAKIETITSE